MSTSTANDSEDFIKMKKYIMNIFKECVKSVLPRNIIKNTVKFDSKTLYVSDTKFPIPGNIFVVGFGKGVLDMALEMEKILNDTLSEAVVSVPYGILRSTENSKIRVMEAADNNMPDERAVENTNCIIDTIDRLKDDDVLIVLISGGGSALLCSPTVPLSDKITTIKLLSSRGASIDQLNSVRKALSRVKGGKLMDRVQKKCTVISLILSDVIGDSVGVIASGPTVPNNDSNRLPADIVKRFDLSDKVPSTVLNALEEYVPADYGYRENVHNYIIGNNAIALRAGLDRAKNDRTAAVLLTRALRGDVALASAFYSDLALFVCDLYANGANGDETLRDRLASVVGRVDDGEINIDLLSDRVVGASSENGGLCLLGGGETTVNVRGRGLGGRNQELALRISADLAQHRDRLERFDIVFFSGGTDGIDGPTDACGAFGYPGLVDVARAQGLDPERFIENNDSYGFYSLLNDGGDLLKIGHTGTNVMDVHVLVIRPK